MVHVCLPQDLVAQQLQHLMELGAAVNTLVAGDESGHTPEQLQAVHDLVRQLNEDRCRPSSYAEGHVGLVLMLRPPLPLEPCLNQLLDRRTYAESQIVFSAGSCCACMYCTWDINSHEQFHGNRQALPHADNALRCVPRQPATCDAATLGAPLTSYGVHRAVIRRKYLENADVFHRKVAEGKEQWVLERTPDDAGATPRLSCIKWQQVDVSVSV